MSYPYSLDDLLNLLYNHAPVKANVVALHKKDVEHGLLSVGLKIHCLKDARPFFGLIEGLGGAKKILEVNYYRRKQASMCWVLPPLGNARAAVNLLEAIEEATAYPLFENEDIQIQVCSPGRLSPRRSALLSVLFYLGSDTLRWFRLNDFETTFSKTGNQYRRGRRITLYDASYGQFDPNFEWWAAGLFGRRVVFPQLPFDDGGRTDVLTATTRTDIENINLTATLLVHSQRGGYWAQLGREFEAYSEHVLERHGLVELLDEPWIVTDDERTVNDARFHNALQKLMAKARADTERIRSMGAEYWSLPKDRRGLLSEIQDTIKDAREELIQKAKSFETGGTKG